jgi:hypothetical protein
MLILRFMQKRESQDYAGREAGSARGFGFLVILVLVLLFLGAQQVQTAFLNRKPTVMSYEAFVQSRPKAQWLRLNDCQLNLFQASYLHRIGDQDPHPYHYYIPVHGVASPAGRICILLKTSEPDLLATISEIKGLKTESALASWTSKNAARAFPKRTVQGVISSGLLDVKSNERSELMQVQKDIADDFIILDSNAEPSLTAGISYCTGGLAALVGLLAYARRKTAD